MSATSASGHDQARCEAREDAAEISHGAARHGQRIRSRIRRDPLASTSGNWHSLACDRGVRVDRTPCYHGRLNLDQRTKIYQLLVAVVRADGVIKPEEREFMRRALARLRLPAGSPPESLRDLGSATDALRALDPDAQSRVLALLVEAAVSDGEVEPREHALLLAAAAALGIEAIALEERIAQRLKADACP